MKTQGTKSGSLANCIHLWGMSKGLVSLRSFSWLKPIFFKLCILQLICIDYLMMQYQHVWVTGFQCMHDLSVCGNSTPLKVKLQKCYFSIPSSCFQMVVAIGKVHFWTSKMVIILFWNSYQNRFYICFVKSTPISVFFVLRLYEKPQHIQSFRDF